MTKYLPILNLIIPLLPISTNHAYPQTKTGRRFLSVECQNFKIQVGYLVKQELNATSIKPDKQGNYFVNLGLYFADKRRRDTDDYEKLIFDAMTGIVYDDDRQIMGHMSWKYPSDKGYFELEISQIINAGDSTEL